MALHLRRYRAAYCCTGRRIFSIIENSRKKGERERKTLPITRRKNLEIVSLLFILPHFYPTCRFNQHPILKKAYKLLKTRATNILIIREKSKSYLSSPLLLFFLFFSRE